MKVLLTIICLTVLLTNLSGLYSFTSSSAAAPLGGTVDALNAIIGAQGSNIPPVIDIALQGDGKIIIAGTLGSAGGLIAPGVARLNPDGTRDTSFLPQGSCCASVIEVLSNGQVMVGGQGFVVVDNGVNYYGIVRLNPDGSRDRQFNANWVSYGRQVNDFMEMPGGKILVAGEVMQFGSGPTIDRQGVALLNEDGTIDNSFVPIPTLPNVQAMGRQADGKIVLGGDYNAATGASGLLRLNADLTLDTSFDPGANGNVYAVNIQSDDKILLGGSFTMLGGGGTGSTVRNFLGRLNSDGSLDTSFNPGADNAVYAIETVSDGTIWVAGAFVGLGGGNGQIARRYIGRLFVDGSLDEGYDPGCNLPAHALKVQPDLKMLVGGAFYFLGGGGYGNTHLGYLGRFIYNAPGSPTPTPTATPTPTPTPTVTPTPIPGEEIFGAARYAFRKRKPIRGVQITLNGPGGSRTVSTDNHGRYSFQSVQPGQYTVTASHPDYLFLDNPRVVTVPQFVHGVYFIGFHPN